MGTWALSPRHCGLGQQVEGQPASFAGTEPSPDPGRRWSPHCTCLLAELLEEEGCPPPPAGRVAFWGLPPAPTLASLGKVGWALQAVVKLGPVLPSVLRVLAESLKQDGTPEAEKAAMGPGWPSSWRCSTEVAARRGMGARLVRGCWAEGPRMSLAETARPCPLFPAPG